MGPIQHPRILEFGVIEVTQQHPGDASSQWKSDESRLYAAYRLILNDLKNVVNHDPATLKQLAAVGVLQAGRLKDLANSISNILCTHSIYLGPDSMVLGMRCVGDNLFFSRPGEKCKMPFHIDDLSAFRKVLSAVGLPGSVPPVDLVLF